MKHIAKNVMKPNLYQFLTQLFQPCLPLFADVCQLSIPQVQKTTPIISKTICYQIIHYYRQQGIQQLKQRVFSPVTTAELMYQLHDGVNFSTLQLIQNEFIKSNLNLFLPNNYWAMLGYTASITEINLSKLDKLTRLLKFFSIYAFANLSDHNQLNENQLAEWLEQQLICMADPQDNKLLSIIEFHIDISLSQRQQTAKYIIFSAWQVKFYQSMVDFIDTQPFSVVPKYHTPIKKTNLSSVHQDNHLITPIQLQSKKSWLQIIQQHWVITATALSIVVFGGLASIFSKQHNHHQDKLTATTNETNLSNPVINDVAIVKLNTDNNEEKLTDKPQTKPITKNDILPDDTDKKATPKPLTTENNQPINKNKPSTKETKNTDKQPDKDKKSEKSKTDKPTTQKTDNTKKSDKKVADKKSDKPKKDDKSPPSSKEKRKQQPPEKSSKTQKTDKPTKTNDNNSA